jgi:hypothetical protein
MGGAVLATFAGAAIVGWMMGWFAERARRSRSDYLKTKALVPGMKSAAWKDMRRALARVLVVVVLFGAAAYGYFAGR